MSEPCRSSLRKGSWSREEDNMLKQCVEKHGEGKWHLVPARAALNRCRKSCRLRWTNYLRPGIKRGDFEEDEIDLILRLHKLLGNRWSLIAGRIPGRTANDIKNYWNTNMRKKIASPTIKTHIKIPISSQSNMVIKPHPQKLCKKSNNYDVLMMPSKAHVITNVSLSNVDVVPLQNINTTQLNEIEVVSNWKDIFWDDFDVRNFLVEDEVAEEEEDEENIISCKDKAFSPTYLAADVDLWDISF